MTAPVATDLDRTLVYSRRSAGADPAELCAVEDREGVPVTWTTHRTRRLLAELDRRATWVPATTRTVAEFRRLRLPRVPDGRPRYAVCAHGGVLLVDGEPDPGWAARIRQVVGESAGIDEVADRVAATLSGPVRRADGLFLVASAGAEAVEDLAAWAAERRWTVRVHGRKLYALPVGLTKTAAVEEIARPRPGPTGARGR